MERTADNEFYYCSWEHNQLKVEIWSTADSIIFKTIRHNTYDPERTYFQYTYDLEKDISTETWYQGDRVSSRNTKQWISENGIPKRFIYKTFEQPNEKKKPKTEAYELVMDSAGVVINKLNGLVFDPFSSDNYFERYDRFRGISHLHESIFKEDLLIKEKEISILHSFDGKSIVYLYQIKYE